MFHYDYNFVIAVLRRVYFALAAKNNDVNFIFLARLFVYLMKFDLESMSIIKIYSIFYNLFKTQSI